MTYDDIKISPFAARDIEPEEAAIWLEMNNLCNARSIKKMLRTIESQYHTIQDLFNNNMIGFMTDAILINLFKVLFDCKALSKKTEVKKLLDFASNRTMALKDEYLAAKAKSQERAKKYGLNITISTYDSKTMADLIDMYRELAERLENLLEDMQDAAR